METSVIENNTRSAGFRLQYLEVLNWGTFDKVSWRIAPNGDNALLTGDIGSGKSTLVDALTCLLVPHHKIIFNKAAGATSKERDLSSYVKGEFKTKKEELTNTARKVYLRPDNNTYSIIIGNFYNEGYDEYVCLCQFFWIGKEGKVEKLFIISTTPLGITRHFGGITDIPEFKKKLRGIAGVQLYDGFSPYSEQFRRLFGMNSDKAIDLFNQTVSMKSVSSLTDFVQEQMLERTDVKEQITLLLRRFEDLNKAHESVVNAREQYQILKPLTEGVIHYGALSREIDEMELLIETIPFWFAVQKEQLLEREIEYETDELLIAEQLQERLEAEKKTLENKLMGILQDIENNGGKRLEQIEREIVQHEKDKSEKKKDFDRYEAWAKQCGLDTVANEADFRRNAMEAKKINEACGIRNDELQEQLYDLASELAKHKADLKAESDELTSLRERKTQIPGWLINFRTQMCIDLQIDEGELPFAGELLQINEHESAWEGAVERLLRDMGISLLVPKQYHNAISKYVNFNTLKSYDGRGIKLTHLEANVNLSGFAAKSLDSDSVVYKVDIKPDTIFYDWLDNYLANTFGHFICTDVEGLPKVSFGITKQGLIKSGNIRHTKDDRQNINNRRNYVLGWSNTDKIKILEETIAAIEISIKDLNAEKQLLEGEQQSNKTIQKTVGYLLNADVFEKIYWQFHMEQIYLLQKEEHELLHNNNMLALLKENKLIVEGQIEHVRQAAKDKSETIGGIKIKLSDYKQQKAQLSDVLRLITTQQEEKFFPLIAEKCDVRKLRLSNLDTQKDALRKTYEGENGTLKELNRRRHTVQRIVEERMREIKDHSKAEYSEIAANIEARSEYLEKFERLDREDLKKHEERFKEELTKNTINSISVFDNQLEKHEKEIKQKIKTINEHLHEIVYNTTHDTYIKLLIDPADNLQIRLFKEELKKCYRQAYSSDADLYSEEKYGQVKKILDRFASADNLDKEWTKLVTDVRQWFEFSASERYKASDEERELYKDSDGKSGGQKEKLAYTILASALAYQFGLQFGEAKSRNFRFVVIDEAFGKGSDDSARYGLELFKKLNLQLLIVTPQQKIHIIENYANTFHYVSNPDSNNSQVSNFSKEKYLEEKQKADNIFNTYATTE